MSHVSLGATGPGTPLNTAAGARTVPRRQRLRGGSGNDSLKTFLVRAAAADGALPRSSWCVFAVVVFDARRASERPRHLRYEYETSGLRRETAAVESLVRVGRGGVCPRHEAVGVIQDGALRPVH